MELDWNGMTMVRGCTMARLAGGMWHVPDPLQEDEY